MQQVFETHKEVWNALYTCLDRILSGHKFPVPLGTDDISPLGDPLTFHAFDCCLAEKESVQEARAEKSIRMKPFRIIPFLYHFIFFFVNVSIVYCVGCAVSESEVTSFTSSYQWAIPVTWITRET